MQAEDAAAAEPTIYSSESGEEGDEAEGSAPAPGPSGALASDEALQALRDKLSGGQ